MPANAGITNYDPDKDIPSLVGKVIFVTGGTAGLGRESILKFAQHKPAHIYFTGRNVEAAESLINEVKDRDPSIGLSFVALDMTSLASVKAAVNNTFTHDRLDILMPNAGVMAIPPGLSKDGFEVQFAINHLANAMVIQQLLPMLSRTAAQSNLDVRIVSLTSEGWGLHPKGGVVFDKLRTPQEGLFGSWTRYGQSKLANIVYARELARRFPDILSVAVFPGVVETGLVTELPSLKRKFTVWSSRLMGFSMLSADKGCYSQVWAATASRSEVQSGSYYMPVGVVGDDKLDKTARDAKLAEELYSWTDKVLAEY
ncbi:oxidoreductase [Podospora didyma]|uniref:Oxidoreductase n=1 Tax=Podospora didyma TaxID=330526 RepID=A0AAE0KL39_9PEZI|nr:oxidoreductase [Podospora didyma]